MMRFRARESSVSIERIARNALFLTFASLSRIARSVSMMAIRGSFFEREESVWEAFLRTSASASFKAHEIKSQAIAPAR